MDTWRRRWGRRESFDRTDAELRSPDITEPVAGGWPLLVVDTDRPLDLRSLLRDLDALLAAEPYGPEDERRSRSR